MLYLLYIDPGTGSILFSLFIGLAATAYFFARTMFIRIKYFLSGRQGAAAAQKESYVIYNEGIQYWNVFKPVLDEFEKRGIAVSYLTSAHNDPFFDKEYKYIKGTYIGEGNKVFAKLNMLIADIVLMTTPALEVYQLKRSKMVTHYSHIPHDTGDLTCYRLFGIDWFDSILLSGSYQEHDIRELEKIRQTRYKELPVIGSTYLDYYKDLLSDYNNSNHPFTVLVSPSWGPGSLLNVYGEKLIDQLLQPDWHIIIRPHPQSKTNEGALLKRLQEKYKDCSSVFWDYNPENIESLSKSDIMISDFSGIIFDYAFLFDKPVIYANAHFNRDMYDAGDLDHEPWKFSAVRSFGFELKDSDILSVKTIIEKAVSRYALSAARNKAKETAWSNQGKSGELAVDFLTQTLSNIKRGQKS
jgi:hypothetical protein